LANSTAGERGDEDGEDGEENEEKREAFDEEEEDDEEAFPFASRIGDALRSSVTVRSAEEMLYVWQQLSENFNVIRTKNKFVKAGQKLDEGEAVGFPDIMLNILYAVPGVKRTPIIAEVQIHHVDILRIGKDDHKLYEIVRTGNIWGIRGGDGWSHTRSVEARQLSRLPSFGAEDMRGTFFESGVSDESSLRDTRHEGGIMGGKRKGVVSWAANAIPAFRPRTETAIRMGAGQKKGGLMDPQQDWSKGSEWERDESEGGYTNPGVEWDLNTSGRAAYSAKPALESKPGPWWRGRSPK
jgi:hypothetical protein